MALEMYHTIAIIIMFACLVWSALGSPLPSFDKMSRIFGPIDRVFERYTKHTKLAYLFSGIIIGFILVPDSIFYIKSFVEKEAIFSIKPLFLVGFSAPSTVGNSKPVVWISVIVRLSNTGEVASSAEDWELSIEQNGIKYIGIIKEITTPVCIQTQRGTRFWVPPTDAMYKISQVPVEPGAMRVGVLQFEMSRLDAGPLSLDDILTISAKNVQQTEYKFFEKLRILQKSPPQIISLINDVHEGSCP